MSGYVLSSSELATTSQVDSLRGFWHDRALATAMQSPERSQGAIEMKGLTSFLEPFPPADPQPVGEM